MKKEECFQLGYASRTVGLKGEIVLQVDVDDPVRYKNLDAIFLERNGLLVAYEIKSARVLKKELTVSLDGITTIEAAKELVGSQAWLPMEALPEIGETRFYFHEIGGYRVIDEQFGEVGVAESVVDRMMQPILRVLRDKTEILLPLMEGAILKVDRENKELHVRMPAGLIDLYLSANTEDDEEV
ncbi:MAG TPA: ribosome maturation factor RimM [Bacteroidia bacterium]|nr:ribosome maturation factor RimM [Bacteroidia bacterium]